MADSINIPILKKEEEAEAQGHSARKCWRQNLNPGLTVGRAPSQHGMPSHVQDGTSVTVSTDPLGPSIVSEYQILKLSSKQRKYICVSGGEAVGLEVQHRIEARLISPHHLLRKRPELPAEAHLTELTGLWEAPANSWRTGQRHLSSLSQI